MDMLNKLSDSKSVSSLPKQLIPKMRQIMYAGLHNIMVIATVLLVIGLLFNLWIQAKSKKKSTN